MTILSKLQASENATEARLQPEEATARIDEILQRLDVIPSKTEQHIFRYAYLYFLGILLLLTLLDIAGGVLLEYWKNKPFSDIYTAGVERTIGYNLFAAVGISLVLGIFYVWQGDIPHILREVFEQRRISVRAGDVNTRYLEFLEHYRDALRSPRRYLLIGSLMLTIAIQLIV